MAAVAVAGECPHGHKAERSETTDEQGRVWTHLRGPASCAPCTEARAAGRLHVDESFIQHPWADK